MFLGCFMGYPIQLPRGTLSCFEIKMLCVETRREFETAGRAKAGWGWDVS